MITYLSILNHMLSTESVAPVTDPNSPLPKAVKARVQLDRLLAEFQIKGWWFNTEKCVTLVKNIDGEVPLPENTLDADPVDTRSNYVQRGSKLYDSKNHTYTLDTDVKCNVIVQLEVEELPQVAATYLLHKAAYDFFLADDGDLQKADKLKNEVTLAWALLQNAELKNADVNARLRPTSQRLKMGMIQQVSVYNGSNG